MTTIDLNVPFQEKDEAKRLGARWDADRKIWFLADGTSTSPFERWLPPAPDINVRADAYFIVESRRECWKCSRDTRVFGLAVPRGHEILQEQSEEPNHCTDAEYEAWLERPESLGWVTQQTDSILRYVTHIPGPVQARVRNLTCEYRIDFSKTIQSYYWMNHCDHCRMKQGDFELIDEFDAPLRPIDTGGVSKMTLHFVHESIAAAAGFIAYDAGIFEHIRVVSGVRC